MNLVADPRPMPAGYFKLVLAADGATPARRRALLEGTGLEDGEAIPDHVTAGQQVRQVGNASRLLGPGWGLELGTRFQAATHGNVGFGAVSAPNLGAGLAVVEHFTNVRNPVLEAWSDRYRGEFRMTLQVRDDLTETERIPLVETYFLSVEAIVGTLMACPPSGARLELSGRPRYAHRYRRYFHAQVEFGAAHDAYAIPADWLERPSPLADAKMHAAALTVLEELSERLVGERFTAARVARLVASGGDAGLAMEAVARVLGISPRTLIRRLADSGTTYREIRDAHRRRRAEELLVGSDLNMGQIAARLGYVGASNFGRACRRWFGCTPRAARLALRLDPVEGGAARGWTGLDPKPGATGAEAGAR